MKKMMKKTTKPKVTIKSLQEEVDNLLKSNRELIIEKANRAMKIADLEAENKENKEILEKLKFINKEQANNISELVKELDGLEVQSTASDLTLAMIEGILDCGYNFFTAYSTVNKIKSILNSK